MTFRNLIARLRHDLRLLEVWSKRPRPKPKPPPVPAGRVKVGEPKPKAKTTPATKGPTKAPAELPKPRRRITMYDSIYADQVPANPEAVAGYLNGYPEWRSYKPLVKRFPHAHHLSITVVASEDGDMLDIENGDATIADAPGWVKRQYARGASRPACYISLSRAKELLLELAKHGLPRRRIRLVTAHYTYVPHICNAKCGYGLTSEADATQWTDKALNRNLDQSLCQATFFSTGTGGSH